MFWLAVACFFSISVGYGFMPPEVQNEWAYALTQWEGVTLAWLAFLCVDYKNTYRKAAVAVLLIWSLLIASTDAWVDFPSWGVAPEALAVLAVILRTAWKIHAVQGHKAG